MKAPLISVIVPVYNVNAFLNRCVDSILSQTFGNFELLLVNDGSTDQSAETCDEYAKADARVKVFHKENGGVTAARKSGVDMAAGEWITFVDGDDSIPPNALLDLTADINDDIFIVIGAYHRKYEDNEDEFFENTNTGVFSSDRYLSLYINGAVEVAPWAKLFRKHLFYDSIFDLPQEIKNKEDQIMNLRLGLNNTGKVLFINKSVYNYTWDRPGSALSGFFKKFDLAYELKIIDYMHQALVSSARIEEFKTELADVYMKFFWARKKLFFKISDSNYKQLKMMQKFVFKNDKQNRTRLIMVFAFMNLGKLVSTLKFK